MKPKTSTNWEQYPITLRINPHLMEILDCGEAVARQHTHIKGFPAYRVGRQIRINRDGLRHWLEAQEGSVADRG